MANNVGSTDHVCRAAVANGVGQVVLITDKAVRPTNVMGASKRLAELVVQAHAAEATSTRFSMVRSAMCSAWSGALFRRQIAAGGPITLTHPEIIRHDHPRGHVGAAVFNSPKAGMCSCSTWANR